MGALTYLKQGPGATSLHLQGGRQAAVAPEHGGSLRDGEGGGGYQSLGELTSGLLVGYQGN